VRGGAGAVHGMEAPDGPALHIHPGSSRESQLAGRSCSGGHAIRIVGRRGSAHHECRRKEESDGGRESILTTVQPERSISGRFFPASLQDSSLPRGPVFGFFIVGDSLWPISTIASPEPSPELMLHSRLR
jgi:hypothetical protein